MGGAPRNPAPGNHLLVWIVKPSGCHCPDAFGGTTYRRMPTPLRSTSPFSAQKSSCLGASLEERKLGNCAGAGGRGTMRIRLPRRRRRDERRSYYKRTRRTLRLLVYGWEQGTSMTPRKKARGTKHDGNGLSTA